MLTSKHHDGFALWPSKYSFSWNSVDVGPHRDIIRELADAVRTNTSMKFGLYHSLFEWFHPIYLEDKRNAFSTNEFVTTKVWNSGCRRFSQLSDFDVFNFVHRFCRRWRNWWRNIVRKYFGPMVIGKRLSTTGMPPISSHGILYRTVSIECSRKWLINSLQAIQPESSQEDDCHQWQVGERNVMRTRWFLHMLRSLQSRYTSPPDSLKIWIKMVWNIAGVLQAHKWENAMTLDKKSWGNRANARLEDFYTSKALVGGASFTYLLTNIEPEFTEIFIQIQNSQKRSAAAETSWSTLAQLKVASSIQYSSNVYVIWANGWDTMAMRSTARFHGNIKTTRKRRTFGTRANCNRRIGQRFMPSFWTTHMMQVASICLPWAMLLITTPKQHCSDSHENWRFADFTSDNVPSLINVNIHFASNSGTDQRNRCTSSSRQRLKSINWDWNLRGRSKSTYRGSANGRMRKIKIEIKWLALLFPEKSALF